MWSRVDRGGSIHSILKSALATVVLLGAFATAFAATADPRIGTWTLISAQSSFDPPDKLSIVSADGTVHVLMTGETHLDLTTKSDGKQTAVLSNPAFDQVQLHRISKKQVEVIEKKNGAVVATIRDALSKDGGELTLTTVRPGHPDQLTVWTRSGGAKGSPDPFAGDWTEDMGKTRLRQGINLTVEADGNDGVRFAADYSYTAHFDGKPYDVKNSRNDTVQLSAVDSHTVSATFRRDQQVTQRDTWTVAADGKTMTLTSTGILESGQHFIEKLSFQRR